MKKTKCERDSMLFYDIYRVTSCSVEEQLHQVGRLQCGEIYPS